MHEISGPNCAGHFKCEEELSEQKELLAGVFVVVVVLENTLSNWLGLSPITVLSSGVSVPAT